MTCLNFLRSSLNSNSSSNQKDFQVEEITSPISLVLVIHRDTITLWLQAFTKSQEKAHSRPTILANKATSGCLKPFSERVLICRSLFILEGEERSVQRSNMGEGGLSGSSAPTTSESRTAKSGDASSLRAQGGLSSVQLLSHVNSLTSHGLQHTRPPSPSPTPGAYSNSCPSCQ